MLDYERIAEDVRTAMHAAAFASPDMLRLAVADFAVAYDEVNDRLRRCGALLRQGLRSEALQQCEIEPNLLDVVVSLDFPEFVELVRLCQTHAIQSPSPVLVDVAAELNEAYALQQPMQSLLRQHRLLALGHCPLPARIKTLRQIAQMDFNNVVWQEDLEAFERERHTQIHSEVNQAIKARDVTQLEFLRTEVEFGEWREPPSPSLVRATVQALERLVSVNWNPWSGST